MCLEPFGATSLFILGRGVLLLVGVVIEKEEEEEKGRGERTGRTCTWLLLGTLLPHFIIRSSRRSQARKEWRRKDRQCTLPRVKVA